MRFFKYFYFIVTGEYNGQVYTDDFESMIAFRNKEVGIALKNALQVTKNAVDDQLFCTKYTRVYAKQLKLFYGLPMDG